MDAEKLLTNLTDEEGFRNALYDDATGKKIKAGDTLVGNPTIGIGWNVMGRGCPLDLAQTICRYHIAETWADVTHAFPWAAHMPEPCQRALCDMGFNMGIATLSTFKEFLALMELGNYEDAAVDLEGTRWFKQVGSRGPKIQALIREGKQ